MIRFYPQVLFIAVCVALTGTAYGQKGCLPTQRELDRFGLERGWWNQAILNAEIDRLLYLTADEENVYAQSRSGIVTAFDAESGRRLWSRLLGSTGAASFPAVTNTDQLLLATGMDMFAVDKFTGQLLWRLNLPHHPTTSPGISDRQAYIGTLEGSAYAFDLATIRRLYQDQLLPEWTNVTTVWRFRAGGPISSPPVSAGIQVNFASEDGSLYSVDMSSGSLRFQFETNAAIRAPIARSRESMYVASDDVRLFSINVLDGKLRWTFVSGTPILKQPQVITDQVFVTPQNGGMYALTEFSGKVMWHQTRAIDFLAATADLVFASDDLGNVLVMSRQDGAVLGAIPMRDLSVRVSNDRTDRVFLASPLGLVVSVRVKGSEFPEYHKFPERQPMLPEFADEAAEPTGEDDGSAPPQ